MISNKIITTSKHYTKNDFLRQIINGNKLIAPKYVFLEAINVTPQDGTLGVAGNWRTIIDSSRESHGLVITSHSTTEENSQVKAKD